MKRGELIPLCVAFLTLAFVQSNSNMASAQETPRCFSIEFFYDSNVNDAKNLRKQLEEFAKHRQGLTVYYRDVNEEESAQKRAQEIADYFRLKKLELPAIWGLKYVATDITTPEKLKTRLERILTVTAFVREGCNHCKALKSFLKSNEQRYPALNFVYKDIIANPEHNQELQTIVKRYQQTAASVPVIHYCNSLTVGFDHELTTGKKLKKVLDYWSNACKTATKPSP